MENTTKRITKAMRFTDIRHMLKGEEVEHGTTVEDALAFIDNEMALLVKKNTTPSKPTAVQKENEILKDKIVSYMLDKGEPVTCIEVWKAIPEFSEHFSNQKVASLVTQLVKAGVVVKTVEKGKAKFSLAK